MILEELGQALQQFVFLYFVSIIVYIGWLISINLNKSYLFWALFIGQSYWSSKQTRNNSFFSVPGPSVSGEGVEGIEVQTPRSDKVDCR